jgi:hypothetical protein
MGSQQRPEWNGPPSAPSSGQGLSCPICGAGTARVLERRDIYISDKAETKKVGTDLAAFRCDRSGHVFFVLVTDLE